MNRIVFALGAIGAMLSGGALGAGTSGTWALTKSDDADKVHVMFQRARGEGRGDWATGRTLSARDFEGLDLSSSERQSVNLTLRSDAGDIVGDGVVVDGGGSGVFSYTPNAAFPGALERLGFKGVKDEDLWAFALADVSLAYARDMKERKIPGLDADSLLGFRAVGGDIAFIDSLRAGGVTFRDAEELISLRVHDVTPEYVREMRASFPGADLEEIVAARIHGVTGPFMEDLQGGFGDLSLEEIVAARIHDLTPEFAARLKGAFGDLSFDNLLAARIHGVSAESAQSLRRQFPEADFDAVLAARIHDLTPDFIDTLKRDFPRATFDDILAARIHDVTTEFIRSVRSLGLDPSLEQLVAMAIHEVSPDYIAALRSKGVATTDIDKLVALKIHGVD